MRRLDELLAGIVLLFGVGCGSDVTDPLPKGAIAMDPPPVIYGVYWGEISGCTGLGVSMDGIRFYYVPGDGGFSSGSSADVVGVWQPGNNSITLAEYVKDNPLVVRHEMLHAILRRTDHPPEYFVDRCGVLVTH
jgi:hypothetical protein